MNGRMNFADFEKECYSAGLMFARKLMEGVLLHYEEELFNARNENIREQYYKNLGKKKTTIKTIMGEVSFFRRYYEHENRTTGNKRKVYLLDEKLKIDTIGLVSTSLALYCATSICSSSYRETCALISKMTGQVLSHQAVWNIVQELGARLKERENLPVPTNEKKTAHVLFQEADGVYINMQRADRPKSGKKVEMKVAVSYEGWRRKYISKKRVDYERIGKIITVGFEPAKEFYSKVENIIGNHYKTDAIDLRVIELYTYYENNQDGLIPYGEQINLPKLQNELYGYPIILDFRSGGKNR